jgi:hypothetical protein
MFERELPCFAVDGVTSLNPEMFEPVATELGRIGVEPFSAGSHELTSERALTDSTLEQAAKQIREDDVPAVDFDLLSDLYLHADGDINEQLDATLHRTTEGLGRATLAEIKPGGLDLNLLRRVEGTRLLRRDQVDDDVLNPVLYRVELVPNRLVVFRRGGTPLVAHLFETTSAPRRAEVSWVGRPGIERFQPRTTPSQSARPITNEAQPLRTLR